jgi:hypothetical protein
MNPRLHTEMMQVNNADIIRRAESRRREGTPAAPRTQVESTPRHGRFQLGFARLRGASAS